MVRIADNIAIDEREIEIEIEIEKSFVRAGGPGGQNVNKWRARYSFGSVSGIQRRCPSRCGRAWSGLPGAG